MIRQSGVPTESYEEDRPVLREMRSGLSGFGSRPRLHPAWRSPEDEDRVEYLLAARIRRKTPLARRHVAVA